MVGSDDDVVSVAERFGVVARALGALEDPSKVLDTIVRLAVDNLHGCEFAGMTLAEHRRIESSAASDDVARVLDEIQAELGEGPCVEAIVEHEVFRTGDLRLERRWPRFSPLAFEQTGVRSVLAIRLHVEEETMGALNLYSRRVDAFDEIDVALGSVFAAHAAVAMSSARRGERLERMAASRDLIGRAKGILMSQSGIGDDEAFDLLRRASQRLNIKLTAVAEQIVERAAPGEDRPTDAAGRRSSARHRGAG